MENALNQPESTAVYFILAAKLPEIRKQFERMTRRAAKLGIAPPRLVERTAYDQSRVRMLDDGSKVTALIPRVLCTVEGESPKLPGWSLLAAIEHIEGETMIHSFDPAADVTAFRGAKNVCHHCNTVRHRASTFVLRHESGEVKQIGRNCLVDFIGTDMAHTYAAYAEMLSQAMDACGEDDDDGEGGFGGGRTAGRWPLVEYLAWCWSAIREFGWMSKKQCFNPGDISTSERVLLTLNKVPTNIPRVSAPTEADTTKALATIEFVAASTETSEFAENLRVLCRLDAVAERHAGLAAAMTMVYDREISRRQERAAKGPSVHVGTVGDRTVMDLTLVRTRYIDSEYGVRTIAAFTDAGGNDLVWFASGKPEWLHTDKDDPRIGETFTVKATIKEHSDYKGRPQTSLSRVQVYTPPAPKTPKPRRKKGELTAKQEEAIEFARSVYERSAKLADGSYQSSFTIGYTAYGAPKVKTIQSLIDLGLAFHSDDWGHGGFGPKSWGLTEWRTQETVEIATKNGYYERSDLIDSILDGNS